MAIPVPMLDAERWLSFVYAGGDYQIQLARVHRRLPFSSLLRHAPGEAPGVGVVAVGSRMIPVAGDPADRLWPGLSILVCDLHAQPFALLIERVRRVFVAAGDVPVADAPVAISHAADLPPAFVCAQG